MDAHPAPSPRQAPPNKRAPFRDPLSDRILRRLHAFLDAWQALRYWVRVTSGAPQWLPARWRRPLTGYLLALLVAVVSCGMTILLALHWPAFDLRGVLLLVGIVVVALTCGVGPSVLATGVSLLLCAGILLATALSGQQGSTDTDNWVYIVVMLVSEIGLSFLAGQSSWARRRAEALAGALSVAKANSDVERQRLRTLLEVLPVPVTMVDTQGRFLEQTPAGQAIWGDSATWARELAEVPAYPAQRPDTGQPVARDELPIVRALTAGQSTFDEELAFTAVDGQRKILLTSAVPMRDATGAIRGAVGAVQDITERKRLEEALRQAEREAEERARELEAIFDALTDGLLVYDAEGRILRSNTAARQLFGFEAQPEFAALPWKERAVRYTLRDGQGQSIPFEHTAPARLLRGEVLTGARTAEYYMQTPDEREVWSSMTGRPLRDAAGTIIGAVGIARDETARQRLERQAAEHAAQLEAIFESIADAVVVTDRQGRVLRMNQAGRTFLGLEQDQDPTGWTFPELDKLAGFAGYTPEGRRLGADDDPIPRVLQGEVLTNEQSIEMIVRTRAGRETQFNMTGGPVRDARGQILGAVFAARDVTEQRRLEQHTRESLDALLAMAEALVQGHADSEQAEQGIQVRNQVLRPGGDPALAGGAGVAARLAELTRRVLDCQSVSIVAVDPATEALTPITVVGRSTEDEQRWWAGWKLNEEGKGEGEGQGQPHLWDVLPADAIAALQAGEPVLPKDVPASFRCWQQLSQVCPSILVPMRVGETLVGGLQVEGEERGAAEDAEADTTEQKEALVQAVARLGALVLERERLLRERTQAQATELALRETQSQMEAFLATAAHDLRTPLTAVVGFLQLAERQAERLAAAVREERPSPTLAPLVGAVRARLEDAGEGTQRLTRLLTLLFDTAAMRVGKLELHRAPHDLAALVREQVAALRVAAPVRTIRLHMPSASSESIPVIPVVPVDADADRIGQVLTNYVTNALKYSAADQPVDVTVTAHDDRARVARVAVRDRGPGLPKGEQARVWEPFHRAPGVKVQGAAPGGVSGGSLGLGLHICKAIVEAHGGQVGIESAVGQGSTFWFTLPLTGGPFVPPIAS